MRRFIAASCLQACRRYRLARLEVFGSAARDDFEPGRSGRDFPVEFLTLGPGEHADAYFGLRESLEDLFGRPVDLVMTRAVNNLYFLEAVEPARTVVYEGGSSTSAIS